MPWRDLGVVIPSEQVWEQFLGTQTTNSIFRVSYSAPISLERINSFAWLSLRYSGGSTALPPTLAVRLYPTARGHLLEIAYPHQLINLGYTTRIFEVKRNQRDPINWGMQIEELI